MSVQQISLAPSSYIALNKVVDLPPAPTSDDHLKFTIKNIGKDYEPFEIWAPKHYAEKKTSDDVILTFGTLGFSLHYAVPFESLIMQEFVSKYITAVYGMNEQVVLDQRIIAKGDAEPMRLFFDFDFKSSIPISDEYIWKVCSVASQTVAMFFPSFASDVKNNPKPSESERMGLDQDTLNWWSSKSMQDSGFARLRSMISLAPVAPEKFDKKYKKMMFKRGAHQNWTENLLLTRPQIKSIRKLIIHFCEQLLGVRNPEDREKLENSWEDVIDCCMFNIKKKDGYTGGLRMIGSCKKGDCSNCDGKGIASSNDLEAWKKEHNKWKQYKISVDQDHKNWERNGRKGKPPLLEIAPPPKPEICLTCKGSKKGKIDSRYVPWVILDGKGLPEPEMYWLLSKPEYFIWAASIHTLSITPTPEFVQSPLVPADKEKPIKHHNRVYAQTETSNPKIKQDVSINSLEVETLMTLIRSKFENWRYLNPKRFYRTGSECYTLEVEGAGDRWCKNSNRNHGDGRGNRIYFTLSLKGLRQKCHSNNGGPCGKDSTEAPILISQSELSKELMIQIFGDMISHRDFQELLRPKIVHDPTDDGTLIGKDDTSSFFLTEEEYRSHIQEQRQKNAIKIYDPTKFGYCFNKKFTHEQRVKALEAKRRFIQFSNELHYNTRRKEGREILSEKIAKQKTATREPTGDEDVIERARKKSKTECSAKQVDRNGKEMAPLSWGTEINVK